MYFHNIQWNKVWFALLELKVTKHYFDMICDFLEKIVLFYSNFLEKVIFSPLNFFFLCLVSHMANLLREMNIGWYRCIFSNKQLKKGEKRDFSHFCKTQFLVILNPIYKN